MNSSHLSTTVLDLREEDVLERLNRACQSLDYEGRLTYLFEHFEAKDILVTSSFGAKSILLLALLSKIKNDHPVYFVDTGYHFKETMEYKEIIRTKLNLNVIDLFPHESQHQLTRDEKWWIDHPKMCCTINKIAPLQPIIDGHKIWVSNLMAFESEFRSRLNIFQKQGFILKFHPFLDLEEEEFRARIRQFNIPAHPLFYKGYESIGCTHCTVKGDGRSGRWNGKEKTECGLHLKYFTGRDKTS